MDPLQPNPGDQYSIRKKLGRGRWKTAYRAWAEGYPTDVALLCFHSGTPEDIARDASAFLLLDRTHQYRSYLTKFHSIFDGADGRTWILEELLDRSLVYESPLHEAGRLSTIARDLSRALTCLHSQGYVHKDVKLDNCGLDHTDTAKIFDVGSISHEGLARPHTIVSRSPELLAEGGSNPDANVTYTKAADVWALGATLFALRTGHYPFVDAADVAERLVLNREVADGLVTQGEAHERKKRLDAVVIARAAAKGAEGKLQKQISRFFGGDVRDQLSAMLAFHARPSIEACDRRWSEIALAHLSKRAAVLPARSSWRQILDSVIRGDLSATPRQIERVARSLRDDATMLTEDDKLDLTKLAQKARRLVLSRTEAKRGLYAQMELDSADVEMES